MIRVIRLRTSRNRRHLRNCGDGKRQFPRSFGGALHTLPSWRVLFLRAIDIQGMDSGGKKVPLLATPGKYYDPRLSPDGKALALITADDPVHGGDVWIYEG